ncbi:MAG: thioredoxin family protein [Bacteroidales bacterium]|nr:thioredoxin family protein [Candidatus Physcocola equi]
MISSFVSRHFTFGKSFVALFLMLFSFASSFAQIEQPVHWNFKVSPVSKKGTVTLTMEATVDGAWHFYDTKQVEGGPIATSFEFSELENCKPATKEVSCNTKAIQKEEPAFGNIMLSYYEKKAIFTQTFTLLDPTKDFKIGGSVMFMCCNDMQCLSPTNVPFAVSGKGDASLSNVQAKPADVKEKEVIAENNAKVSETKEVTEKKNEITDSVAVVAAVAKDTAAVADEGLWTPVIAELQEYGMNKDVDTSSLWAIFISGLIGGFIAVLTPCVWPIIPMTVSFFIKRSGGKKSALLYGVSIILIYLVLGLLVTKLFSADTLNGMGTNAAFNVFLFLLLVVFACSFFGGFEIMLPASWSTAIDNKAEASSGVLGILLMAVTLVLVSFSCTGPIIGTLLVSLADSGDILGPAVGMFGFALALAVPFTFFAFFPNWLKSLPRSGNWLNMVKVLLGFFELAFSLKFLSVADGVSNWNLLSRPTFIAIWIVIFVFAGVYLLGKIRMPHDSETAQVSVPRLMLAMGAFSFAVYMVPGLFGAPLNAISAFAPPLRKTDASIYNNQVEVLTGDYETAVALAKQSGKPLVLDFSGYGCVNCRKMESAVWTDPKVAELLNDKFVLASLFCDDRKPLAEPMEVEENGVKVKLKTVGDKWSYLQRHKFGSNMQPFYVVLDHNGKPLCKSAAYSEEVEPFVEFLTAGLKNFKK